LCKTKWPDCIFFFSWGHPCKRLPHRVNECSWTLRGPSHVQNKKKKKLLLTNLEPTYGKFETMLYFRRNTAGMDI
jgi:hypothetical protein